MPYIKEKSAIFTKIKGSAQNNYGIKKDSFFVTDFNDQRYDIKYVPDEEYTLPDVSKNLKFFKCLRMKIGNKYLSDIKTGPIAKMSSMIISFMSVQTVLLYLSNYPERVKLMYRKDNNIYALFEIYSDEEMQDIWNVNYLIGQIDLTKYNEILETNITGIKSFFITGMDKKITNSLIKLGMNLEIKIYE